MNDMVRVYEAIKSGAGEWVNAQDICEELILERRIVCDYASSMIGKRSNLYPGIKRKKTRIKKGRAFAVQVFTHNIWFKYVG